MRTAVVKGSIEKEITIQKLEKHSSNSVFVLNASARKNRGDIIFSVQRQGGGEDIIRVPKTWIPVDLTDQMEKEALLKSARFRGVIRSGMLVLLNPDYANKLLEGDAAQEEIERLLNERNAARAMLTAKPTTAKEEDADEDDETPQNKRRKNLQKQREEADGGRSAAEQGTSAFDIFLNRLQGQRSESSVLNLLKNEGELTKKELKKVIATFGSMQKVVRWAERRLER